MNILLFIDRLGSGGAQTQISLLARELVADGHRIHLATYHANDVLGLSHYLEGVTFVDVGRKGRWNSLNSIARLVSSERFDAGIAFLAVPSFYLLLAAIKVGFCGVLVVGERASFKGGKPTLRDRLLRVPLRRADFVVANSSAHASELKTYFPALSSRVCTIVNGVDLKRFYPAHAGGAALRVTAIGRIVRDKDILTLVSAVSRSLALNKLSIKVSWYGRTHDQAYREECDRLIEKMLPEGIWHWGGEVCDVSQVLRETDLLVHTSRHEGCPNAVCEALASGVPCLMTDVGDAEWLIGSGQRGAIFSVGDDESLASALRDLAAAPLERWVQMRRNCRLFAERELAPQAMARKYMALITEASRG